MHLTEAERAAVRQNGFVKAVAKGRSGYTYRLCFRLDGRQRSRSLGRDRNLAAAVQEQLQQLRALEHIRREARASLARSRRLVRRCQQLAAAELASQGVYFHGRQLRRRRAGPTAAPAYS